MKNTLETINRMKADGVIVEYAIGGAVGATLYLEPAATLDVDAKLERILERHRLTSEWNRFRKRYLDA